MINLDNKTFRAVGHAANGWASEETLFEYQQEEDYVSATYSGGSIVFGHLIGMVREEGILDLRYHHVNILGDLVTGACLSMPALMPNGKIRLDEKWKLTGDEESE